MRTNIDLAGLRLTDAEMVQIDAFGRGERFNLDRQRPSRPTWS